MSISVAYYSDSNIYYITELVTSVKWSGDTTQAQRDCEIDLANTKNGTTKAISFTLGKEIRFYDSGTEVFRGVIFNVDIKDTGDTSVTAHDYNYYLTRNTDSLKFTKMKASQIVKSICKRFGIDYGVVDDTGYVFSKLIFRDKTIYDMIVTALTETKKKNGRTFIIGNEKGKLTLRERKNQVKQLVISDGSNLTSASYSKSIDDLRNSVRITGKSGPDKAGVTVSDSDNIKKYGLMREKKDESNNTDEKNKSVADALLKELNKVKTESNVDAIGDSSIIAGKQVQVSESMTGISGGFYVLTDSHTYTPTSHTMSLKVSKTLELNEIEYEPPDTTSTSSSSKSTTSVAKDNGGIFMKPVNAPVSSPFGRRNGKMHPGIDYAKSGTVPISAAASGKVARSYRSSSYGECIIIHHVIKGKTYETLYAHMRSGSRKYHNGQTVKRGAVIGYMGSTGDSTGQHLHFEINIPVWNPSHSNAVNPAKYV
jgi:murein DD-endopeptidase MepM/ murein hydrolase activator NlpD